MTDRVRQVLSGAATARNISFDDAVAARVKTIPAGQIGDAAEFGDACAFFCSAQAGYITAQNLLLDGGAYPGTF
jgi:3-oxoacyl-[acyl-carrier protein] reductase